MLVLALGVAKAFAQCCGSILLPEPPDRPDGDCHIRWHAGALSSFTFAAVMVAFALLLAVSFFVPACHPLQECSLSPA